MKKNIIFYLLLAITMYTGCTKDDGPVPKEIQLERVPLPSIVKNGGSLAIDMTNLSAFSGKFDVGLHFLTDIPPSKLDVVIRKNGNNSDVKLLQAGVASFPTSFTITAAQISTLFGAALSLGDNYDIGLDVYTQSGKKYEAFPILGAGYAAGVFGQPGASTTVRYSAICQYNPSIYEGNFVVVTDDWQDTNPGDIITLTKIDDTHFSFIYPTAVNPIPIIVIVNPLSNVVSITQQLIGSVWVYGPQYTDPRAATTGSDAFNFVAPCARTLTLNMQYGFSGGTFGGTYPFVLVKQ